MSALDSKRFAALGKNWTARFSFNAQCAIEEETGRGFFELVGPMLIKLDDEDRDDAAKVMAAMSALRTSDIRLVFHHALLAEHPDLTRHEAGELIEAIGMGGAMEVVAWAIARGVAGANDEGEDEGNGPTLTKPAKPNLRTKKAVGARG